MSDLDDSLVQQERVALQETLHVLMRGTAALQASMRATLMTKDRSRSPEVLPKSFYRLLEWQRHSGQLPAARIADAFATLVREVDRYGVVVANLVGFLNRDEVLEPKRTRVDLDPLLSDVVDIFDGLARTKGIDIKLEMHGASFVFGDEVMLYRLFVNLVDNAVKYSYSTTDKSEVRHVDVKCRRHSVEGDFVVTVQSYGVGVDDDEILSGVLFEYGKRGRLAADREREGSGIGLAEAKRIVEAHHGHIKIGSERKSQTTYLTTVTVIIPSAVGVGR